MGYYRSRFKGLLKCMQLLFLLIICLFNSCINNQNSIINKYNFKKLNEYKSSSFNVEIYSIDLNDITKQKLFSLPLNCCRKCSKINWHPFDKSGEDIRVYKIIQETAILINTSSLNELLFSAAIIDSEVFYAACYTLMYENMTDKFNYYDVLYILDFRNNKYYIFKNGDKGFFPN